MSALLVTHSHHQRVQGALAPTHVGSGRASQENSVVSRRNPIYGMSTPAERMKGSCGSYEDAACLGAAP